MPEEKKLEELMNCEFCNKSYDKSDVPRIVTLGGKEKTACNKCIADLKIDNENLLVINEKALSLITALTAETLGANTEESCLNKIQEECNKLKRKIKSSTEQRIKELNELSAVLIKQIDDFEKNKIKGVKSHELDELDLVEQTCSDKSKDVQNMQEDADEEKTFKIDQMVPSLIASKKF